MRLSFTVLVILFALSGPAFADNPSPDAFDWDAWQHLPVLDGGRYKPLDTLAWERLRMFCNRGSFVDPETDRKLSPTALYLILLFDWQGWDQSPDSHLPGASRQEIYFANHKPDKWDRAPLLRVDFLPLRRALGMPENAKYVSPFELSHSNIEDPNSHKQTPFITWTQQLIAQKRGGFTTFEKRALELSGKLGLYQDDRMGKRLYVLPASDAQEDTWLSIADVLHSADKDKTPLSDGIRQMKIQWQKARTAYHDGNPQEFQQATHAFLAAVAELGAKQPSYPQKSRIELEVKYNHWVPFRFAWIFTTLAFVFLLLSMGTQWKTFYGLGWASFLIGVVAMFVGFGMRVAISGRAPVTNMYESVIYVGLGAAVFGLLIELISRKQFALVTAAAIATVALILADNCPAVLDPRLRPLQPVLRSNFWLVTHVMTITLSYAALALASGISDITLGYYLVGSQNKKTIGELSKFTYKSLQIGVLLLATGTILGGVWADYSWGRFWGWDPKEVWSLIALLGYVAVLHARYAGWVGHFGLAALSAISFSLVIMAWYGVNFVLGAGLHSYGFGGGGQQFVYAALGAQILFVIAVWIRRALSRH